MSKPVLSLEAFADWCEKQGDREYDYWDIKDCAVRQYARFLGMEVDSFIGPPWGEMNAAAAQHEFAKDVTTFSALAARLRSSS